MQGFGDHILGDPLAMLIAGLITGFALALTAVRLFLARRAKPEPLAGLFSSDAFNTGLEKTGEPAAKGYSTTAILRGRIDHLAQVEQVWGHQSRADAIEHVAQVMRSGVRKGDTVAPFYADLNAPDSDGSFVIHARGASEGEASDIALRLLKSLARTQVSSMGDTMRVTASFGVAGRRNGERYAAIRARADAALGAAQGAGDEQIVTASEWEEIKLLPPPSPPIDDKGAQAA